MHDATDNAPIVCTLDASHIRRQMRLNPPPLLIAQPKQVLPHGPDPPKRIRYIWNQDCFAAAPKLMSSHPSTWPTAMTGFCFANSPPIVLSHWHYDHFSAANRFPIARTMSWIAPNQTLGPG